MLSDDKNKTKQYYCRQPYKLLCYRKIILDFSKIT